MKYFRQQRPRFKAPSLRDRNGVSLAEVLVSMMIMAIGVVSLAALFPISVLRTAQATQLTHAVFLRNNAEAFIEANPSIINNNQIFGASGIGGTGVGVIDPLGVQFVGTPFAGTVRRSSGGPSTVINADQLATLPDSWTFVRDDTVTGANLTASPPYITLSGATGNLKVRNNANLTYGLHRVIMYDSSGKFAVIRNVHQVAGTTLPGPNDLSWWDVNGAGLSLNSGPSLPSGFTPTRVRIEFRDRRYTWMLTVRKHWVPNGSAAGPDGLPGRANTDDDGNGVIDDLSELHISPSDDDPNWVADLEVVVFFNRAFTQNDETQYALNPVLKGFDGQPGVAGVDDDQINGTDDPPGETGWPGSDDNRTALVTIGSARPPIKKGGYMLEITQMKWYRIVDATALNPASTTVQILFDQDVRSSPGITPQGVFMKGVVEVYSLGSRTGQQ